MGQSKPSCCCSYVAPCASRRRPCINAFPMTCADGPAIARRLASPLCKHSYPRLCSPVQADATRHPVPPDADRGSCVAPSPPRDRRRCIGVTPTLCAAASVIAHCRALSLRSQNLSLCFCVPVMQSKGLCGAVACSLPPRSPRSTRMHLRGLRDLLEHPRCRIPPCTAAASPPLSSMNLSQPRTDVSPPRCHLLRARRSSHPLWSMRRQRRADVLHVD